MVAINLHILDHFIQQNRLSAFRLYSYVKAVHNNHLHAGEFSSICEALNISLRVLKKNLKELQSQGVCYEHAEDYFRFNSWKTWLPKNKNRIIDVSIEQLKDLKTLRTLYYLMKYKSAYYCSRKNAWQERRFERDKKHTSGNHYPVSASFVKMTTYIEYTEQTLLKHLNRAKKAGLVSVKSSIDRLFSSTSLTEVRLARKFLDFSSCFIQQTSFGYSLCRYKPNELKF